jgi:hypothetical protein
MPMWVWVASGLGSLLGLSLLVGFVVARILRAIGRHISKLYETEDWTTAATQASRAVGWPQPDALDAELARAVRLR